MGKRMTANSNWPPKACDVKAGLIVRGWYESCDGLSIGRTEWDGLTRRISDTLYRLTNEIGRNQDANDGQKE